MHLILEECQPVSRRVSFHKRRSSVRKSEKDAIGSHLIQAADNVPRKLKFHFLITFDIALLNSKCHIDLVTTPSKGFIEGFFEIQIFPSQGKYVCGLFGEGSERILSGINLCRYFLSLLSCWYCHCYLGQGNATRRVLLLAGAGENWNLHDSWPRF